LLCSAAAAGVIVWACHFAPNLHVAAPCLLLLLAVMTISSRWGFWDGVAATVVGDFLIAFYFIPPVNHWYVESGQYWVVLFTFLVVGLATARVAAHARRLTLEALARSQELEQLDSWSRGLTVDGREDVLVPQFLESLVRSFGLDAAAFYCAEKKEVFRAGQGQHVASLERLQSAAAADRVCIENSGHSFLAPVHVDGGVAGALAASGSQLSELTFRAIAERLESTLEKSIALEKATDAEAARRSQELKSAVLDSLLHEVKTPLSVVKTAVSSLLSGDWNPTHGPELLDIVNQEVDRLDASVSEVFWVAYIDAGKLEPARDPHDIRHLIDGALRELQPELRGRRLSVELSDPSLRAVFDFRMMKGVLKELLKNALKYSPRGTPLSICGRKDGLQVVITVTDCGIGVSEDERMLIFEKHYRGKVNAPGTGLGLAIAKTIVEAHGGTIGVDPGPDGGSTFHFSIPGTIREAA